jgi:outer membrane protein assembly factor BamB
LKTIQIGVKSKNVSSMKHSVLFLLLTLVAFSFCSGNSETNKWRGPLANGIYNEPGLLEKWPENGPDLLWTIEQLGDGFSSPVIANGKIFVSGAIDSVGYIFVISMEGQLLKKFPYGNEYIERYPGSRSTPSVTEEHIYMHTGVGKVVCLNQTTGELCWQKDIFNDFDGKNLRFGITESLVVDGDKIYVSPGGEKYNVVALNRFNGEVVWTTEGKGCLSAYCTPLLFDYNNEKMLVTMMGDHILGINRESGQLRWSFPYKNQRGTHPNTPLYDNGELFCFSGYGHGGVKLRISEDNSAVEQVYFNDSLQSKMGGAILLDGRMYGSGDNVRRWYCVDWKTGEVLYSSKELANGVIIAANGLLYKYTDRGELALVKPNHDGFEVVGKTQVECGTAQHWAHPVINNGVLYIRHGKALVAYIIKK